MWITFQQGYLSMRMIKFQRFAQTEKEIMLIDFAQQHNLSTGLLKEMSPFERGCRGLRVGSFVQPPTWLKERLPSAIEYGNRFATLLSGGLSAVQASHAAFSR